MSERILKEIETNIKESQQVIELGSALERLLSNRDFKQVISVGYLEKEAVRLVHLKASPDMKSAEKQAAILTQLDSIGCLQQYLHGIRDSVDMASKSLEAAELTRDEILAEG